MNTGANISDRKVEDIVFLIIFIISGLDSYEFLEFIWLLSSNFFLFFFLDCGIGRHNEVKYCKCSYCGDQ